MSSGLDSIHRLCCLQQHRDLAVCSRWPALDFTTTSKTTFATTPRWNPHWSSSAPVTCTHTMQHRLRLTELSPGAQSSMQAAHWLQGFWTQCLQRLEGVSPDPAICPAEAAEAAKGSHRAGSQARDSSEPGASQPEASQQDMPDAAATPQQARTWGLPQTHKSCSFDTLQWLGAIGGCNRGCDGSDKAGTVGPWQH